jgi:hypothetical protein
MIGQILIANEEDDLEGCAESAIASMEAEWWKRTNDDENNTQVTSAW